MNFRVLLRPLCKAKVLQKRLLRIAEPLRIEHPIVTWSLKEIVLDYRQLAKASFCSQGRVSLHSLLPKSAASVEYLRDSQRCMSPYDVVFGLLRRFTPRNDALLVGLENPTYT